jgi:hypothetical protein
MILMSVATLGVFQIYWMYKNWWYFDRRDNMGIRPGWRAWFGIFYIHQLLRRIHGDWETNHVIAPQFYPSALATGWVVTFIAGNVLGRFEGPISTLVSLAAFFIFLWLLPVQVYVGNVNREASPPRPPSRWSLGQFLCLIPVTIIVLSIVSRVVSLYL